MSPGADRPSSRIRSTVADDDPGGAGRARPAWTAPIDAGVRVGEQHRHAVGDPHHQDDVGPVVTSRRPSGRPAGAARPVDDVDPRSVHLVEVGQRRAGGEVGQHQAQVLGTVGLVVGPVIARFRESKGTPLTPPNLSVKARSTGPSAWSR